MKRSSKNILLKQESEGDALKETRRVKGPKAAGEAGPSNEQKGFEKHEDCLCARLL